jgi:integrase
MMPSPKLLDRVRDAVRTRHYSRRTEEAYVAWIRRYIVFHRTTHPGQMGASEISQFLTWLAVDRRVSASTQNQALSALLFLYTQVLAIEIGSVPPVVRARTPERLPVVLSREEIGAILKQLTGTERLIVMVLYGSGVRLEECLDLRVKDLDFDRHQIIVRQGKGQKDRATMLPAAAREGLTRHLADVRRLHERDLARGCGRVVLPFALDRKFSNAPTEQKAVAKQRDWPVSRNASGRILFVIRSRPPCSKMGTTFARCRHCSATVTFDDDDLSPRDESWRVGGEESDGSAVTWIRASHARIHESAVCAACLEAHADERLRGDGPARSSLDTRQCQRVFVEIRDLAGGFRDRLRAYPSRDAAGIPARIASIHGNYDTERWRHEGAGYARLGSLLIVGRTKLRTELKPG